MARKTTIGPLGGLRVVFDSRAPEGRGLLSDADVMALLDEDDEDYEIIVDASHVPRIVAHPRDRELERGGALFLIAYYQRFRSADSSYALDESFELGGHSADARRRKARAMRAALGRDMFDSVKQGDSALTRWAFKPSRSYRFIFLAEEYEMVASSVCTPVEETI